MAGFNIPSLASGLGEEDKVSALIDEDLRWWRQDIIQQCFNLMVATNITNIPLSWTQVEDKLIWNLEKNGEYSVKSAYHLIRNQHEASPLSPSSHS